VLADYVGNDIYGPTPEDVHRMLTTEVAGDKARTENEQAQLIGKHLAQASYGSALKPMGLAMLIDAAGNDRYAARTGGRGGSLGGVLPPAAPDEWSHAMLLDLGGHDAYAPPNCNQNQVKLRFNHAVCYDTEYSGASPLGAGDAVMAVSARPEHNTQIGQWFSPRLAEYEDALSSADLWTRFNAVGALVQLGPGVLPDVIQALRVSTDDQLNRDLEEVVTQFILARQMNADYRKQFVTLLAATEPQVQRYAARMLGWWRVKIEAQALQRARLTVHDEVKPDVVWALGQLRLSVVAEDLLAAAEKHESLDSRRFAIAGLADQRFLASLGDPAIADRTGKTLLVALADPDPVIRTHAATGLERYATDESILQVLKEAHSDSNVYVRRAAARSVILSGDAGGIPVLIDSLQFRSIDTYKNYDHELAKEIAFFLGVDFEEDRRYAAQTWRAWWEANGHRVNLSKNLKIMREIQHAFTVADETRGVDIFRGLQKANPNNIVILKRFDRYCYEWITFRLLTLPVLDETVLNRCLALQTIRVELNPQQADKHGTLAYYYGRLNRFEDALNSIRRAIVLDPDNPDYQQRQKVYQKLTEDR
jgi:hypothetical protein